MDLVTCLGTGDSQEAFIREGLKPNVTPTFFFRPDAPTVRKRRFVSSFQLSKIFEVSFLDDDDIGSPVVDQIGADLEKRLGEYDLVIVADFGHGLFVPRLVSLLTESSAHLAVNVQTNSANFGYNVLTKYARANFLSVDQNEMRLAYRSKYGDLCELIRKTADHLDAQMVATTGGGEVTLMYQPDNGIFQVPALSDTVVDTVGAGDAFFSVTAPCVKVGLPGDLVGFIGNAVGALAVQIVGNRESVEPLALNRFITTLLK